MELCHERFHFISHGKKIIRCPGASRTRHDFRARLPQSDGFQQSNGAFDFFAGVGGQADADGIADPVQQQCSDPRCTFDNTAVRCPRFRHTHMQGIICFCGKLTVCRHGDGYGTGFQGNGNISESAFFQLCRLQMCRFAESRRHCAVVISVKQC